MLQSVACAKVYFCAFKTANVLLVLSVTTTTFEQVGWSSLQSCHWEGQTDCQLFCSGFQKLIPQKYAVNPSAYVYIHLGVCVISSENPICYFEFITNPHSFGQTIENIFYTSFLIRVSCVVCAFRDVHRDFSSRLPCVIITLQIHWWFTCVNTTYTYTAFLYFLSLLDFFKYPVILNKLDVML